MNLKTGFQFDILALLAFSLFVLWLISKIILFVNKQIKKFFLKKLIKKRREEERKRREDLINELYEKELEESAHNIFM